MNIEQFKKNIMDNFYNNHQDGEKLMNIDMNDILCALELEIDSLGDKIENLENEKDESQLELERLGV